MPESLSIALKEWDLQISLMLAGRQALLLRKGGILEAENEFVMEHSRFLLFPTFVHQDSRMVRAEFRAGLTNIREEPEEIEIRGFAEVAGIFQVPAEYIAAAGGAAEAGSAGGSQRGGSHGGRAALRSLADLHPWDEPLFDMRFNYRPEKPLYLVVVRACSLPASVRVRNTLEYAGCKSWVPLLQEVSIASARPALSDHRLAEILERVKATLADSERGGAGRTGSRGEAKT